MQESVRQPLASGESNLTRWARLGAALPGVALGLFAIACFVQDAPVFGAIGTILAIVFLVPAAAAIFQRSEAPSDIFIRPDGLEIAGGRWNGLRVPWTDIESVVLEEGRERRTTITLMFGHVIFLVFSTLFSDKPELAPDDGDPTATLWLRLRDGRSMPLARGVESDEVESLRALSQAMEERVRPVAPAAEEVPPFVVRCPSCGAASRPSESETTSCNYCSSVVSMPLELRQHMAHSRAAAQAARSVEKMAAKLTRLPSARTASLFIAAQFLVVAALSLITFLLLAIMLVADAADGFSLGTAALATGLLVLAAWWFGTLGVAERRASGIIGALFGARAPRNPGEGWGCRSCGAPLPDATGTISTCAYCAAQNVVGLDSRRAVVPMKRHALDLAKELGDRAARRRRRLMTGIGATCGGGFAMLIVMVLVGAGIEDLYKRYSCSKGDGNACYGVALSYFTGSIRKDRKLALEYAVKACRLNDTTGCCMVLSYHEIDWGIRPSAGHVKSARQHVAGAGGEKVCER